LFLFTLWRYLRHPGRQRLLMCGLAMGAVLGTKFSAVFLAPVAAALLVAAVRWPATPAAEAPASSSGPDNPPRGQRASRVGPNGPCPCGNGKKYKKCHGAGGTVKMAAAKSGPEIERALRRRKIAACAGAFLAMCVLAAVVIEALYFFSSDPFLYLTGLRKVNADRLAGYLYYLHGKFAPRFYSYYVAAYLLKEPVATILLAATGLAVLWRSKSTPILSKLFVLLPPAVFLVAMTIFADDLGIRYLIPAMPFAHLAGGIGLASLFGRASAWGRYLAAALCLWVMVAAAGIYPDHLSYFNETACLAEEPGRIGWDGGSRCGPLWLDDSNVDWGQGLKQLRSWMDRYGNGRTLRLAYFGTFPPEAYGLRVEKLEPRDLRGDPRPGLYAVSAHQVARLPAMGEKPAQGGARWLRRTTPVAIVGHAFYIYDVR